MSWARTEACTGRELKASLAEAGHRQRFDADARLTGAWR